MRHSKFMRDTIILTIASVFLRMTAIGFQSWLAARVGAAGIGLYQLTGSVTVLFAAVAVSGIRFTATRLVSEELGLGRGSGVKRAMRRCIGYALVFGMLSAAALYVLAEPLGFLWIGDARTVRALQIAALGLPAASLSSVSGGYFTAVGRVWKAALVQVIEQISAIFFVVCFLGICNKGDLQAVCAAITGGNVSAAYLGLLLLIPLYLLDRREVPGSSDPSPHLTRRMFTIAVPLAVSSYARTALSTFEHLLIPGRLRLSGLSAEAALAGYGAVHGMALSAVLFPACLMFAMAELLVPKLTEAQMQGGRDRLLRLIHRARSAALLYAIATALGLMLLAHPIAERIFHTDQVERYILLLSPLVPVMNLDTITDACLRGIGQQRRVMRINVLDAAFGVALVWILLPSRGIRGYVEMIWLTECGNLLLSSLALHRALHKESSGKTAGG